MPAKKYDPYINIAPEYDMVMGERNEINFLKKLVPASHPKAETILELACGTGKLLKPFSKDYNVSGLDHSKPMLAVAAKTIKNAGFYHADMTKFSLDRKFDIILCLFNSLNHLADFNQWKSTFKHAARHLNKDGVFIFDINTQYALEGHFDDPVFVQRTGSSTIITEFSEFEKGNLLMSVSIFQKRKDGLYSFKESKIYERAYPVKDIMQALKKYFSKVIIKDQDRKKHSKKSEVLYFICSNPI